MRTRVLAGVLCAGLALLTTVVAGNASASAAPAPAAAPAAIVSGSLPDTLDTYVWNFHPTSNFDNDSVLDVGYNAFGTLDRSFLTFDATRIKGRGVRKATLQLWQQASGSCAPQEMLIVGAASVVGPGTTWNTQPSEDGHVWNRSAFNNGAQCGRSGATSLDITALVQAWSSNRSPKLESLGMFVPNELSTAEWKVFYSENTFLAPHIDVTYDDAPVYQLCRAGGTAVGQNQVNPVKFQAGQSAKIVLTNRTVFPADWDLYDGGTHRVINSGVIGSLAHLTFVEGIGGALPVGYNFYLMTSNASVVVSWNVYSDFCP